MNRIFSCGRGRTDIHFGDPLHRMRGDFEVGGDLKYLPQPLIQHLTSASYSSYPQVLGNFQFLLSCLACAIPSPPRLAYLLKPSLNTKGHQKLPVNTTDYSQLLYHKCSKSPLRVLTLASQSEDGSSGFRPDNCPSPLL